MLSNKKNLVFSLYVLILTVVCPLIFWSIGSQQQTASQLNKKSSLQNEAKAQNKTQNNNRENSKWLSFGEKILVTADSNSDKQAGTQAFADGDFNTAIVKFKASLALERNDPETWIYLNNATAINSGNYLKIAVSVPIGGNLNVAKEMLRGVAQAQDEINRNKGIDGKLIAVEIANDNNDPEVAKQIAAELVKHQEVLAVVGHNSSDASIAAAPIYQEGGLIAISPTSVAKNLSNIGSYIFRTTPNTRAIADVLAERAVTISRKTKIAICADSQAQASSSFKEEFTIAVFERGGQIVNTECDFASADFHAEEMPSQAIGNGADALLLAPSIDKVHQALAVARANKGRLPLFGSQAMYVYETLQKGQGDTNGTVISVIWHPAYSTNKAYMNDAKQMWGGSGSWRTATAYDASEAIFQGLKSTQERARLQQVLADPSFTATGATGEIKFMSSGDRLMKGLLVKIQPGKESGTGYDFAPLE